MNCSGGQTQSKWDFGFVTESTKACRLQTANHVIITNECTHQPEAAVTGLVWLTFALPVALQPVTATPTPSSVSAFHPLAFPLWRPERFSVGSKELSPLGASHSPVGTQFLLLPLSGSLHINTIQVVCPINSGTRCNQGLDESR